MDKTMPSETKPERVEFRRFQVFPGEIWEYQGREYSCSMTTDAVATMKPAKPDPIINPCTLMYVKLQYGIPRGAGWRKVRNADGTAPAPQEEPEQGTFAWAVGRLKRKRGVTWEFAGVKESFISRDGVRAICVSDGFTCDIDSLSGRGTCATGWTPYTEPEQSPAAQLEAKARTCDIGGCFGRVESGLCNLCESHMCDCAKYPGDTYEQYLERHGKRGGYPSVNGSTDPETARRAFVAHPEAEGQKFWSYQGTGVVAEAPKAGCEICGEEVSSGPVCNRHYREWLHGDDPQFGKDGNPLASMDRFIADKKREMAKAGAEAFMQELDKQTKSAFAAAVKAAGLDSPYRLPDVNELARKTPPVATQHIHWPGADDELAGEQEFEVNVPPTARVKEPQRLFKRTIDGDRCASCHGEWPCQKCQPRIDADDTGRVTSGDRDGRVERSVVECGHSRRSRDVAGYLKDLDRGWGKK